MHGSKAMISIILAHLLIGVHLYMGETGSRTRDYVGHGQIEGGLDLETNVGGVHTTVRVDSLPHRKWKEIKQEPGTAGPGNMLGCCLIYFHFRWGKLSTLTVL